MGEGAVRTRTAMRVGPRVAFRSRGYAVVGRLALLFVLLATVAGCSEATPESVRAAEDTPTATVTPKVKETVERAARPQRKQRTEDTSRANTGGSAAIAL